MPGFHGALRPLITRGGFNGKSSQITAPNREVLEFIAHMTPGLWAVGRCPSAEVLMVMVLQVLCRVCDIWPQFPPAFLTEWVRGWVAESPTSVQSHPSKAMLVFVPSIESCLPSS